MIYKLLKQNMITNLNDFNQTIHAKLINGHASGEMTRAYDKSEREDNPTKKVNLVGFL